MIDPQRAPFNVSRIATWSWWVFLIGGVVQAQLTDQWWWVPISFVAWFGFLLAWAAVRAVVDGVRERRAP